MCCTCVSINTVIILFSLSLFREILVSMEMVVLLEKTVPQEVQENQEKLAHLVSQ